MDSWNLLKDKNDNPILKFDDGTNRQITIHYNKNDRITASHLKNADGNREFINPADAFIAAELIKKLS